MNRKELEESIKEQLPEIDGTDEEKELKLALFIYIKLAEMKEFDERFYFGNRKMIRMAEREAIARVNNPDELAKKRKILCITMANLYKLILSDFGIDSETITEMTDRERVDHVTNILKLKSGKRIIADVQLDMHRIQAGLTLRHFGVKSNYTTDILSSEELTNMLIDIGYINSREDYRDEKIERVKREIEGLNLNEDLEMVLNSPEIYDVNEEMGVVEAYKYYYAILKTLFSYRLGNEVFLFRCSKKTEKDEIPDFSFGIYGDVSDLESSQVYLYSKGQKRMLPCDLETLTKLEDDGLKIGMNNAERAVEDLKNAMRLHRKQRGKEDEAR